MKVSYYFIKIVWLKIDLLVIRASIDSVTHCGICVALLLSFIVMYSRGNSSYSSLFITDIMLPGLLVTTQVAHIISPHLAMQSHVVDIREYSHYHL